MRAGDGQIVLDMESFTMKLNGWVFDARFELKQWLIELRTGLPVTQIRRTAPNADPSS